MVLQPFLLVVSSSTAAIKQIPAQKKSASSTPRVELSQLVPNTIAKSGSDSGGLRGTCAFKPFSRALCYRPL